MRRYVRARAAGGTFFFTLTLEDRRSRALIEQVAELRAAWTAVHRRHPFVTDAVVILPDHLHAVWTMPGDDDDYAMRWMLIKGEFTRRLSAMGALGDSARRVRGVRGERSLWQRRFWEHQIRNEEDLRSHIDYIHFNPVKHGLVACAGDWPHSSFHRYVREGRLPAQ